MVDDVSELRTLVSELDIVDDSRAAGSWCGPCYAGTCHDWRPPLAGDFAMLAAAPRRRGSFAGSLDSQLFVIVCLFEAMASSRIGRKNEGKSSRNEDESSGYSSSTASIGDESVQSLVSSPRKLRSPQAARSNKRGIEKPQQKLLLQDIEETGGGIKNVSEGLTAFCDKAALKDSNSTILYGVHQSKERRRVENKIRYWAKKLEVKEYLLLLKDFQVSPSAATVEESAKVPKASKRDMPSKPSRKASESKESTAQNASTAQETEPTTSSSNNDKKGTKMMSGIMTDMDGIVYGMYCVIFSACLLGSEFS
jgi:hypothetical protein